VSDSWLVAVEAGSAAFDELVERLERRGESDLSAVEPAVREILAAVRAEGDSAVRRFVERFERRTVQTLYITDYGGAPALASLSPEVRAALDEAHARIARYHEKQAEQLRSFEYAEGGVTLGSRVTPLERVGVYVPGGKARYPSSVLMSAVIARVAGVRHVIVASPDPCVEVRAACHIAGVDAVLDAGGAHAVAALAYGTETVPSVDKIVGPGNLYVAAAKRLVFGEVDIDSIAGPSEILVVADDTADPAIVTADLLSQAEHDEAAYALLVTTSASLVSEVQKSLSLQLATLPRRNVAEASLTRHGAALVVAGREELAAIANRLAVEHVALHVREPAALGARIERAGALFVGAATPEAAGDYLAGPSHVLPTGGAARHGAPLGVYDFVSRTSVISYDAAALAAQAGHITALARVEGFEAHARAVEVRLAAKREQRE
jgi:histidinol dehydrogenase